jgi:hypothetical protein
MNFNTNQTHPIINNSHEYVFYKKYISIHSEDRDMSKYPNSSQFDIELPEDYLNVISVRLSDWSFPANYNTFSPLTTNVIMTFNINKPYNPADYGYSDPLQDAIFQALNSNINNNFTIQISTGFYNPTQIVTELTNRFNEAVSIFITDYFNQNGYSSLIPQFNLSGQYNQFIIVYNEVAQNIWFGNKSSNFILTNQTSVAKSAMSDSIRCNNPILPDFSNWGLPGFLGLDRTNDAAIEQTNNSARFYYGDVNPGDNGYWLTSDLSGASTYYFAATYKINLMGNAYMYLDIDLLNCIDETSPYTMNNFTQTTNKTNGIVNSSFAKIAIPTTPVSQWFDGNAAGPYKLFLPPAERIRRLKFKLRYHNGQIVDFGVFNYSFTLEFDLYAPQQLKNYKLFQSQNGIAMPSNFK